MRGFDTHPPHVSPPDEDVEYLDADAPSQRLGEIRWIALDPARRRESNKGPAPKTPGADLAALDEASRIHLAL